MIQHQKKIDDTMSIRPQEGDQEEVVDIEPILPLEGNYVEVKERLKILTSSNLSTRLPVLLAQIKDGSNSYRLNRKIRQILYL